MAQELATDLAILGRLALTLVLAGAIGWERDRSHKAAGIRTHMLVGLSATLFMALGSLVPQEFRGPAEALSFNPFNIMQAVVTGISFLGAGMIFVSRGKQMVHGLTTAASILATAAMAIAVGLERYLLAVGTTILILLILRTTPALEKLVGVSPEENKERVHLSPGQEQKPAAD
jgi:putative Mg2+ transporter-C (MgtC) family protein